MRLRRPVPGLGHVTTVLVTAVAAAGIVGCAALAGSRNGTSAGTLADRAIHAGRARPRATMTQIMSAAPGTYIDRLMIDHDSTVERWSDHVKHPLKVWIDSSESPHGAQAGFPAAVRHAFATWAATGIPLHVAFVASARDADVRVHWTGHLKGKTGSTTWRTDRNGWLSGGDITLATHVGDGTALDARGMRVTRSSLPVTTGYL